MQLLYFGRNALYDEVVLEANLGNLTCLRVLDLSDNHVAHLSTLSSVVQACPSLTEVHFLGNPCFPADTPAARAALLAGVPRCTAPGFQLSLNGVSVSREERLGVVLAGAKDGSPDATVATARLAMILVEDVHAGDDTVILDLSNRQLTSIAGLVRGADGPLPSPLESAHCSVLFLRDHHFPLPWPARAMRRKHTCVPVPGLRPPTPCRAVLQVTPRFTFGALKYLSLAHNALTTVADGNLHTLPALTTLDLRHNVLASLLDTVRALSRCPHLRTLSLQHGVVEGVTDDPSVYAASVGARLPGLDTVDGVANASAIRGAVAQSALEYVGKVCGCGGGCCRVCRAPVLYAPSHPSPRRAGQGTATIPS